MLPPSQPRHYALATLGLLGLGLLATLLDPWAYAHLAVPGIYDQGWGRIIRNIGYLPFWLLAALALYLSSQSAWTRRGALLLALSPTLAGAVGEILKLLIRRGRPLANNGLYVFRPYTDRPFSTRDFGMPSGDVVVAFAACVVLSYLWPRARWLWMGLALACAFGRVMVGAHFLSDVTVAAIVGWASAAVLSRLLPLPDHSAAT